MNFYKLEKLPRAQRLRKIAKVFAEAENRLYLRLADSNSNMTDLFSANEIQFFSDAVKFLAADTLFPPEVQAAFREMIKQWPGELDTGDVQEVRILPRSTRSFTEEAEETIKTPCISVVNNSSLQRSFNTIKHLLLNETGRSQADWDFTGSDGRLDPAKRRVFEGMMVYFEDIRSPFNVGAMFRTAESFGAEKIFLSPFCADPKHRRAQRTAMGCIEIVPWERRELFAGAEGPQPPCPIFALETGGIPLSEFPFPRRGLLIAGSEELGISPQALSAADSSLGRVSIPCYGAKGSLNVSVAFGIVMQAWAECAIITL
ncbi:MAG: TrmH family RNA methyltransferase [Treponema sp.]|jgi:TrmH family RNA methyltransferase|nr:TrmH family RNA methyltransferase [Treponema sp.]